MTDEIATAAEALEATAIPALGEVHTDPGQPAAQAADLPDAMKAPPATKSPARWAYERVILYIQNFEKQLDAEHEVAMGFAGDDAGVLRIEGIGFFDPDIITFYGTDPAGRRTQLIQHVSQLSVMLRAMPKAPDAAEPQRIGFRLAEALNEG